MSRTHRTGRILVVLTAVVLVVAACGDDSEDGADTTTTAPSTSSMESDTDASTTTTTEATTTTTETDGRISTESPVGLSFDQVGDIEGFSPEPQVFIYDTTEIELGIIGPTESVDFSDLNAVAVVDGAPDDLHAALSLPGMPAATDPEPITVGGLDGERFYQEPLPEGFEWTPTELDADQLRSFGECIGDQCLPTVLAAGGFWQAEPLVGSWYVTVDVDGTLVVIAVTASDFRADPEAAVSAEELWSAAEPLLDSLTWEN